MAGLLAPHAADLITHVRGGDPRILDLARAAAGLADEVGLEGLGGPGWPELYAALDDSSTVRATKLAQPSGRRDNYALAAGVGTGPRGAAPIARGVASINWGGVPPAIFDAGENTVDWSVELAVTAVVAVVRAAVIGPDRATGVAVQLRSGAIGGAGALDADARATIPLVDTQQQPVPETAAWDHDWSATSVIVGAPISVVTETPETRERVRRWARARLDRPPDDAFLAEILAAESDYWTLRRPAIPYAERVPNNYRVVQWNTGNVGKSSLQSIADNPALELVGCYAWSPEKVGRDAGELVGIPPLGVAATNDVDELLALKPDCVVYNPMWIDVDELVRILSGGVNVVTTASFITGHNLGAGRDRILEACRKGGSTIFGSGVSPGFAELLAIVSAMVCNRIDKVTVTEAADTTFYDSPATEIPVGFGKPIDHPELQAMTAQGTAIFGEAVRLVADALGVELDQVRCVAEYAQTTADLDLGSWTIAGGCVAGVYASWQGIVGGKTLIDLNVRWRKGQTLEPDWKIDQDGWVIQIDGQPTVTTKVGFLPPPYFQAETIADFMALGHIMTAMPTINAIPAVVAAAPGIVTYTDLPLTLPRGHA